MEAVGIVGAGQMGAGIAQVAAVAGFRVLLADVAWARAEAGREAIARRLDRQVAKGDLSGAVAEAALARIAPQDDLRAFAAADLVIEAATEDEAVKRGIFAALHGVLRADAILATNTSSLPVARLAGAVPDPARFIGLHFFNPVPMMPLAEVIRGPATSDETERHALAFVRRLGKEPIPSADTPGFIVNRILIPMLNEACFALGEGVASVADIDRAMTLGLNHQLGPLALADLIGLDTCLAIARVLEESSGDPKYRPAPLLVQHVEAGRLGRKSGRGFYDYAGGAPVPAG